MTFKIDAVFKKYIENFAMKKMSKCDFDYLLYSEVIVLRKSLRKIAFCSLSHYTPLNCQLFYPNGDGQYLTWVSLLLSLRPR